MALRKVMTQLASLSDDVAGIDNRAKEKPVVLTRLRAWNRTRRPASLEESAALYHEKDLSELELRVGFTDSLIMAVIVTIKPGQAVLSLTRLVRDACMYLKYCDRRGWKKLTTSNI